ncbi:MAG TPA: hypothetical protein PLK99_04100 [Burkholderiales bacterium]|nr:hypothetical protein [Burkholderiales bacterium]
MKQLIEPILLFILAYLFLLALSFGFGNGYAGFLIPFYKSEVALLAQDFHVQSLTLAKSHGENVVALTLSARHYLVGRSIIYPGTSISASTLVGQALQHPLLMLPIAFAWPARRLSMRIKRAFLALPFLLLLECLDIPLVLLGSVQDLVAANLGPGADTSLVGWMNFMNGGGRLALSIGSAIALCLSVPGEPHAEQGE